MTGRIVQRRRLALLAILAAARARPVSRDRLVALLWPETRDEQARALLSDSLYVARKALGDDALIAVGDDLRLNPERLETDVAAFEDALDGGDFERAVAAYGGPFLDGVHVSDAPEFERWAAETRDQLQRRFAAALGRAAGAREERGDHAGAVEHLRPLLALDPGDASATVRLMLALERAGNVAAALQAARVHEALMREEVGRGAASEVARLAERLRRDTPRPIERAAPPPEVPPRETARALEPSSAPSSPEKRAAPAPPAPRAPRAHVPARAGSRRALVTVLSAAGVVAAVALLATRVVPTSAGRSEPVRDSAPGAPVSSDTAAAPRRVAVLPFVIRGDERSAYLRDAVASLLASKLDGAGPLQSVDPNVVLARAEKERGRSLDGRATVALARELGADYVVVGDVLEAGGRMQLSATMLAARAPAGDDEPADTVGRAAAEDVVADGVFRAADTLAVQLLAAWQASTGQRLTSAAAFSTSSLPALKAYLQGETEYRAGRYAAAAEAFDRATRLDTTFALAYARLTQALGWTQTWDGGVAQAKVTRLRDRLPPRYRVLADANAAFARGDMDTAERLTREAAERYAEPELWIRLGEILYHENPKRGRPVGEARAAFERAISLLHDERETEPMFHLIALAAHEGRLGAVDTLTRRFLVEQPSGQLTRSVRGTRAMALGDQTALARTRDELRTTSSGRGIGLMGIASNVPDARFVPTLLGVLADSSRGAGSRALALEWEARLAAGRGRWREARAYLDELASVDPSNAIRVRAWLYLLPYAVVPTAELRATRDALAAAIDNDAREAARAAAAHDTGSDTVTFAAGDMGSRYTLGVLEIMLGAPEAALRQAEVIERTSRRIPHLWEGAYAPELRARVLASRGDWAGALAAFSPRNSEPLADRRLVRAELLARNGRDAEALRWFDTADQEAPNGVMHYAVVHFRMAQILQRMGDRRSAAAHFALAAARWSEADPEVRAMLEAARAGSAEPSLLSPLVTPGRR